MLDDVALVDTNVLVYAVYSEAEHHAASRSLLHQAQTGQIALCLVPQVLTEFYAVVTNARRVTAPRQPDETIETIEKLLVMPGIARWCATGRRIPAFVWPRRSRHRRTA